MGDVVQVLRTMGSEQLFLALVFLASYSLALGEFATARGRVIAAATACAAAAGFAAFTSLSLSWCNLSGTIGSIIAVDRVHNEARWFTVTGQFHPATATLQRRGLVGVGYSWHFVCTD